MNIKSLYEVNFVEVENVFTENVVKSCSKTNNQLLVRIFYVRSGVYGKQQQQTAPIITDS